MPVIFSQLIDKRTAAGFRTSEADGSFYVLFMKIAAISRK